MPLDLDFGHAGHCVCIYLHFAPYFGKNFLAAKVQRSGLVCECGTVVAENSLLAAFGSSSGTKSFAGNG